MPAAIFPALNTAACSACIMTESGLDIARQRLLARAEKIYDELDRRREIDALRSQIVRVSALGGEVVRSAYQAVSKGQSEAALALALVVLLFRRRESLSAEAWRELKG